MNERQTRAGLGLLAIVALGMMGAAAQNLHYDPTLESLDRHPLPQWYADAKLGIFIHWGLYSVPGWAACDRPKVIPKEDEAKWNAYAEWYYNTLRIPGSPTQAYHREHYGADFNYYDFARSRSGEQEVGSGGDGRSVQGCGRALCCADEQTS